MDLFKFLCLGQFFIVSLFITDICYSKTAPDAIRGRNRLVENHREDRPRRQERHNRVEGQLKETARQDILVLFRRLQEMGIIDVEICLQYQRILPSLELQELWAFERLCNAAISNPQHLFDEVSELNEDFSGA